MWPGPYGNWGSKNTLIASLDQSLKRMNVDYVDIFYHHRPDLNTPIEETMGALESDCAQQQGAVRRHLRYTPEQTELPSAPCAKSWARRCSSIRKTTPHAEPKDRNRSDGCSDAGVALA